MDVITGSVATPLGRAHPGCRLTGGRGASRSDCRGTLQHLAAAGRRWRPRQPPSSLWRALRNPRQASALESEPSPDLFTPIALGFGAFAQTGGVHSAGWLPSPLQRRQRDCWSRSRPTGADMQRRPNCCQSRPGVSAVNNVAELGPSRPIPPADLDAVPSRRGRPSMPRVVVVPTHRVLVMARSTMTGSGNRRAALRDLGLTWWRESASRRRPGADGAAHVGGKVSPLGWPGRRRLHRGRWGADERGLRPGVGRWGVCAETGRCWRRIGTNEPSPRWPVCPGCRRRTGC